MIKVDEEPPEIAMEFRGLLERCVFCSTETKFWHERTNNPVCQTCSPKHKVSELTDHMKNVRRRKPAGAGER